MAVQGLEAAAREARYGVLRSLMQAEDWLLSAHHEDDQAETLLLNLLRGSGVGGLAGIGSIRAFGKRPPWFDPFWGFRHRICCDTPRKPA